MVETTKPPFTAFALPGCREEEEGKTLSADSVENNEDGRLFQWGAAVLNMENHMQHIHLHLSNASQQGIQGLAPVKTASPVCATNTSVAATDNFETINTFDANLIHKINRQLCLGREP